MSTPPEHLYIWMIDPKATTQTYKGKAGDQIVLTR